MSTMHLSPNSSKETIIKASNQVLKLSCLRALVIVWNSMPTILMLWLPKLLNISTCSMYWAEKASRLKTQLQFIYPWYDLQLQIVVQYGTTPLPLSRGRMYTEIHLQDHRTCTFIQRSSPMSTTTHIRWKTNWTLPGYSLKDTEETHSPNTSVQRGRLRTITKQRCI